jgi:hypothetical protein
VRSLSREATPGGPAPSRQASHHRGRGRSTEGARSAARTAASGAARRSRAPFRRLRHTSRGVVLEMQPTAVQTSSSPSCRVKFGGPLHQRPKRAQPMNRECRRHRLPLHPEVECSLGPSRRDLRSEWPSPPWIGRRVRRLAFATAAGGRPPGLNGCRCSTPAARVGPARPRSQVRRSTERTSGSAAGRRDPDARPPGGPRWSGGGGFREEWQG